MTIKTSVERRLLESATSEVGDRRFSPECRTKLEQHIADGVKQMALEQRLDSEESVAMVQQNLRRFVSLMIERHQGTSPVLGLDSYEAAHVSLCPVFPFCRGV